MPLRGSVFPWLSSIPAHSQVIPTYFTGQPGKSQPLASLSELSSRSSEVKASSTRAPITMARCWHSSGKRHAPRGPHAPEPSRMKEPLCKLLVRGSPLSSLQLCVHFSWEENEIPALELAPRCQNGSDLCNHTRFSGCFISAVMRLCKPLKAKCFLLL